MPMHQQFINVCTAKSDFELDAHLKSVVLDSDFVVSTTSLFCDDYTLTKPTTDGACWLVS